jgi:hypothetical protein
VKTQVKMIAHECEDRSRLTSDLTVCKKIFSKGQIK